MASILRKTILVTGFLWFLTVAQVFATHQLGNELVYTNVSPGVYLVSLKFYRDCSGIGAANTYQLMVKSEGCNAGRSFSLTRVGNGITGNLYCSSITATCSNTSQPNFEEYLYTTTVAFTNAEQACTNWTLSVNFIDGNRPNTANVYGAPVLFAEAFLKLGASINNNSARFNEHNVPVPLVNSGKPVTIAFTASDPDGDSLSYKMVGSLTAHNSMVTYNDYTLSAQAAQVTNPANPSQVAQIPRAGTFSARFPLHSYKVNWNGSGPYVAERYFALDSINGKLSFIPSFYKSNTSSSAGENKYNVAVQVNEFRKINGVMEKVGSVTRDILITLVNSGQNHNPSVSGLAVNSIPVTNPVPILEAHAGTPITITVNTSDADATDVLETLSNADSVMSGAVVTILNSARPTATITWTPVTAQVRSQPYYFNVIVKDDACPGKGYHSETIGVRVKNAISVTGSKEEQAFSAGFIAFPNPFTHEVSFKFSGKKAGQTILIYNSLGQEVDRIALTSVHSETQQVRWDKGEVFAAGTYIAKLIAADRSVQTLKFTKVQ
jgi:hypothetical protein